MNNVETKINSYINSFLTYPHPILTEIEKEHNSTRINIQPNIGLQGLHLLKTYILALNAQKVLEIGTCIGHSAIFAAQILKITGGKLTTVEIDKRFIPEIKTNIRKSNTQDIITVVNKNAQDFVKLLNNSFDLIILDANKPLYVQILDDLIANLRKGGIIFADDTLFKPMGIKNRLSLPMDSYNKLVFNHPFLESTIIPIGDGITVSIKI